jgi:hypothetical protein
MQTLTSAPDIPRLHVVPDAPTPVTITVTPATLLDFYHAGWADCAAALSGP